MNIRPKKTTYVARFLLSEQWICFSLSPVYPLKAFVWIKFGVLLCVSTLIGSFCVNTVIVFFLKRKDNKQNIRFGSLLCWLLILFSECSELTGWVIVLGLYICLWSSSVFDVIFNIIFWCHLNVTDVRRVRLINFSMVDNFFSNYFFFLLN